MTLLHTVQRSPKVGGSCNVFQMKRILNQNDAQRWGKQTKTKQTNLLVERKGHGGSLWRRPECVAIRRLCVNREVVQQLSQYVRKLLLKVESRQRNAIDERHSLSYASQMLCDGLKLVALNVCRRVL